MPSKNRTRTEIIGIRFTEKEMRDFNKAFEECDCIVAPVTTTTAFGIGEKIADPLALYMADILTISANLAGIPGMSVPVAEDTHGLPIGVQLMARHFNEMVMLNVAQAIEDSIGH